eukprot:CAMPEP_0185252738 /NCGR_PEP_ID=MMETSP1359-20130426/1740_1 /TAXON_ID=552665 /ORGANISM="Bigelowiella longifila, Strain CCMP242" /LENGTH=256 /DNA_ID=CAMNT_0027834979 /DNA_START=1 /DNA_END=771 /DNA_ORIENTATION=-
METLFRSPRKASRVTLHALVAVALVMCLALAIVPTKEYLQAPGVRSRTARGIRSLRCFSHRPSSQQPPSSRRTAIMKGATSALIASGFALTVGQDAQARRSSQLPGEGPKKSLARMKIPREDYTSGPEGLLYYDIEEGGGGEAKKGQRVAIHYSLKWSGITIATSRQGAGVTGGNPYGFDIGEKVGDPGSAFIKGLDLAVQGMRVGGVRRVIVPPELAYGNRQVQEISPNSEVMLDIELLSIKTTDVLGLNRSVKI